MSKFDKMIIGLAEAAILAQDCSHSGNWRLPCTSCNAATGKMYELISRAISDEGSRRHMLAGHDDRDGNVKIKPK